MVDDASREGYCHRTRTPHAPSCRITDDVEEVLASTIGKLKELRAAKMPVTDRQYQDVLYRICSTLYRDLPNTRSDRSLL